MHLSKREKDLEQIDMGIENSHINELPDIAASMIATQSLNILELVRLAHLC